MTRPGIEPRSPGPLANTLTARPFLKCYPSLSLYLKTLLVSLLKLYFKMFLWMNISKKVVSVSHLFFLASCITRNTSSQSIIWLYCCLNFDDVHYFCYIRVSFFFFFFFLTLTWMLFFFLFVFCTFSLELLTKSVSRIIFFFFSKILIHWNKKKKNWQIQNMYI